MLYKRLGLEAIEMDWKNREDISNCFKIPSSLIIPEGCRRIGMQVFQGCNILERLEIPGSVKEIGVWSFLRCYKLREVVISESMEAVTINYSAFYLCRNLKKVVIPRNVVKIEGLAFFSCDSAEIVLESNKERVIGRDAFGGCKSIEYVEEEVRS